MWEYHISHGAVVFRSPEIEFSYLRAYPVMNAICRKIITSESVVAMTASPISLVASMAA